MKRAQRIVTLGVVTLLAAVAPSAIGAGESQQARPSLTIKPRTIVYGTKGVLLSGVVPSRQAGQVVTILAKACRFTEPAEIGTVRTKKGGTFRFAIQPMLNTSFSVRWNNRTSSAVAVGVRPQITVRRVAAGRYRVAVSTTNGVFLNGKRVLLQRAAGKRWVTIGQGTLAKASAETAITVVSAVTVAARVPAGTPIRAVLPQSQARCYRAVTSATAKG